MKAADRRSARIEPHSVPATRNGGAVATREESGWTAGFVVFAGVMLMLVGFFHGEEAGVR
jgi:hypothetical protein